MFQLYHNILITACWLYLYWKWFIPRWLFVSRVFLFVKQNNSVILPVKILHHHDITVLRDQWWRNCTDRLILPTSVLRVVLEGNITYKICPVIFLSASWKMRKRIVHNFLYYGEVLQLKEARKEWKNLSCVNDLYYISRGFGSELHPRLYWGFSFPFLPLLTCCSTPNYFLLLQLTNTSIWIIMHIAFWCSLLY